MSDLFKCYDGSLVDLDDPKTYKRPDWKKHKTTLDLHKWAWSELGMSLYYMRYFHPDVEKSAQAARIHGYCFWYANEWQNHMDDTEENRMWFRKFLFKFMDEVENQC